MKETCTIYFRALGFELADTDILAICLYVCQPLIWSVSYWHWFCLLCLLFHSLDQKGLIFSSDRNAPVPIKLLSKSFKFKISESCPYILKLVKSHAMHLWSPPFLFCKCSLVISNRNKHFEYVHLLEFFPQWWVWDRHGFYSWKIIWLRWSRLLSKYSGRSDAGKTECTETYSQGKAVIFVTFYSYHHVTSTEHLFSPQDDLQRKALFSFTLKRP